MNQFKYKINLLLVWYEITTNERFYLCTIYQDSEDESSMSDGDDEENETSHIAILRHSHY
jgi:hypothetical protein